MGILNTIRKAQQPNQTGHSFTPPADPDVSALVGALTPDEMERWAERTSIREYDGGVDRATAEAAALGDVEPGFAKLLPMNWRVTA